MFILNKIRKINAVISLFAVFILFACTNNHEPTMIDTKRFLIAACFEDGIFTGTKDFSYTEEYISFSFFYYPSACNEESRNIIKEELQRNKEGVLRIGSLWMLKIASDTVNSDTYFQKIKWVLDTVKNESEGIESGYGYYKVPAIVITIEEVKAYYKQALKNRLNDMSIPKLSNSEAKALKNLVYDYCIDNTEENTAKVREYIKKIASNQEQKNSAVGDFLIDLHPGLYELFTGEEYIPPNEIYPR